MRQTEVRTRLDNILVSSTPILTILLNQPVYIKQLQHKITKKLFQHLRSQFISEQCQRFSPGDTGCFMPKIDLNEQLSSLQDRMKLVRFYTLFDDLLHIRSQRVDVTNLTALNTVKSSLENMHPLL